MKRQIRVSLVKPQTEETGTSTSRLEVTPEIVKEYFKVGALMFAAMYGSKKLCDTIALIAQAKFIA